MPRPRGFWDCPRRILLRSAKTLLRRGPGGGRRARAGSPSLQDHRAEHRPGGQGAPPRRRGLGSGSEGAGSTDFARLPRVRPRARSSSRPRRSRRGRSAGPPVGTIWKRSLRDRAGGSRLHARAQHPSPRARAGLPRGGRGGGPPRSHVSVALSPRLAGPHPPVAMSRIRVLDPSVVGAIRAGEVVDRPAAVVKELVENALDAGSTLVAVQAASHPERSIRVQDDGAGMSREDALLALRRHATSKIESAEDLSRTRTLGFRGEPLVNDLGLARLGTTHGLAGAEGGDEGGAVDADTSQV